MWQITRPDASALTTWGADTGLIRGERERFGIAKPIVAVRVALPCDVDELPHRVDARCLHAGAVQHPAKTPLTTADIERIAEFTACHPRHHHGIEHMLPSPIAALSALAHGVDPGLCRAFPTIVHC